MMGKIYSLERSSLAQFFSSIHMGWEIRTIEANGGVRLRMKFWQREMRFP